MDIVFKSKQVEKLCNDDRLAQKKWGKAQAGVMGRRLDDLRAARCLEVSVEVPGVSMSSRETEPVSSRWT